MADTDDEEKIKTQLCTKNAAEIRIPFVDIELLDRNNPYGLNPELFDYGIPVFKLPLSPYIRTNDDGTLPCLPSPALDLFFEHTKLTRNEINRNLLLGSENLRKAGSGLSTKEYNDRIALSGLTLIKFVNKADNTIATSFFPGVTDALVIPEPVPEKLPVISKEKHANRNEYQQGFAPRELITMRKMAHYGFFELFQPFYSPDGFTKTHNLTILTDDIVVRLVDLVTTIKKDNYDYRGVVGKFDGKFEGMQFVYNKDSKQLVVDVLNKGTYDYVSPNVDNAGHSDYDFYPWIYWGNLIADDESIYMPQETEEKINEIDESSISDDDKQKRICGLFEKKDRPKYGKKK